MVTQRHPPPQVPCAGQACVCFCISPFQCRQTAEPADFGACGFTRDTRGSAQAIWPCLALTLCLVTLAPPSVTPPWHHKPHPQGAGPSEPASRGGPVHGAAWSRNPNVRIPQEACGLEPSCCRIGECPRCGFKQERECGKRMTLVSVRGITRTRASAQTQRGASGMGRPRDEPPTRPQAVGTSPSTFVPQSGGGRSDQSGPRGTESFALWPQSK